MIDNLQVHDQESICKSENYPITFHIKSSLNVKGHKRKILNFKRANWDALNYDLCHTNWNALLDCTEPEIAWSRFKHTLFSAINNHIPTITIDSKFQSPWFDSDVWEKFRIKQRAHKKFKSSKLPNDELKFSQARREFKRISSQKMRDNMYNTDDPALITKKFWSREIHIEIT